MNIRKQFILITFIALFLLPSGKGADISVRPDSTYIQIRLPNAENIAKYHHQKAFDYAIENQGNNSFQLMVRQWLIDKIERLFRVANMAESIELILLILIVAAVTAIILRMNDINPIALFRRKDRNLQPIFTSEKENIDHIDFPFFIDKAVKGKDFRLAVRYHYLQSLALLALAGKIQTRDAKTNRDYLSEIGDPETRNAFAGLVYGFEFIWYGEFIPDENQYLKFSASFVSFQKSLQE